MATKNLITKELLDVEFSYHVVPASDLHSDRESKTVTIGIYDNIEDAVNDGNKILKRLGRKFRFNDSFKTNGLFGRPTRLVCDFGTNKGVEVFVHIRQLVIDDIDKVMDTAFANQTAYMKWKNDKK